MKRIEVIKVSQYLTEYQFDELSSYPDSGTTASLYEVGNSEFALDGLPPIYNCNLTHVAGIPITPKRGKVFYCDVDLLTQELSLMVLAEIIDDPALAELFDEIGRYASLYTQYNSFWNIVSGMSTFRDNHKYNYLYRKFPFFDIIHGSHKNRIFGQEACGRLLASCDSEMVQELFTRILHSDEKSNAKDYATYANIRDIIELSLDVMKDENLVLSFSDE